MDDPVDDTFLIVDLGAQFQETQIEEASRDGSFASVDSKLASLFVLSVVNSILIWYRPDGGKTRDEIVETFISMIENGLTPR